VTIPFINATLTKIAADDASAGGDYEVVIAAPAARWTGSVAVYVTDTYQEVEGATRIDLLTKTRMEIPYYVGRLIQQNDHLTYTFEGAAQERIADNIIRSELVGRVQIIFRDA
jgi:PPE-repeat protein